jgi:xanthine dehydrogenase iron-sulfur cluster and FAD-binding subunit A
VAILLKKIKLHNIVHNILHENQTQLEFARMQKVHTLIKGKEGSPRGPCGTLQLLKPTPGGQTQMRGNSTRAVLHKTHSSQQQQISTFIALPAVVRAVNIVRLV